MVVLLVRDRQSWTRPALTRHGEGRRVPVRAFPRPYTCPSSPQGGYPDAAQRPDRTPQQGAKVMSRSQAVSPSPCASREGVTERYA